MLRQLALAAFAATLVAAPAMALNSQPEPPGRRIVMADGSVFVLQRSGKLVSTALGASKTLPPGTYKLKDGHVITVDATGVITAASRAMLNPQPLPP